jgi:hypothetical protein
MVASFNMHDNKTLWNYKHANAKANMKFRCVSKDGIEEASPSEVSGQI